jgi:hypothetical protein
MTTPDRSRRDELAQRIRDALAAHADVREVNMFGGLSFIVGGRMAVAAGRDGDLLVRIDPARHEELLRHGGEPASMGVDRPMGEGWLTVPSARIPGDADLAFWVAVGLESGHQPI